MSQKSRRLPPLATLRAFETAARYESMVRAADELHVTHGAVSRLVKALELDLEESLFERRNRGIHLTERGRALSVRLTDVFLDLRQALDDFRSHRVRQSLIVSCEPTLALRLLIPAVAELKRETGLEVRVLSAGGPIDFSRDHVDVAIRRNDFRIDAGLFAIDLVEEWTGLVLAPALVDSLARGRIDVIHSTTRPTAWRDWKRRSRAPIKAAASVHYEHFYLALQAAEAEQGATIASAYMVASDLADGRLVAPFGFSRDGTKYVALSTTRFNLDDRKAMFLRWFNSRLERSLPA